MLTSRFYDSLFETLVSKAPRSNLAAKFLISDRLAKSEGIELATISLYDDDTKS